MLRMPATNATLLRALGLGAVLGTGGLGVLVFSLATTNAASGWQTGDEATGAAIVGAAPRTSVTSASSPKPGLDAPAPEKSVAPTEAATPPRTATRESPTPTSSATPTPSASARTTKTPGPAATATPKLDSPATKSGEDPPPAPPVVAPELRPVPLPSTVVAAPSATATTPPPGAPKLSPSASRTPATVPEKATPEPVSTRPDTLPLATKEAFAPLDPK